MRRFVEILDPYVVHGRIPSVCAYHPGRRAQRLPKLGSAPAGAATLDLLMGGIRPTSITTLLQPQNTD